jgi:hypothetical protein
LELQGLEDNQKQVLDAAEHFEKYIGKEYHSLAYRNVNIDDPSLAIVRGLESSCFELASLLRENAKKEVETKGDLLKVRLLL